MKIFNWVHKRFHHTTPKDGGFASSVKSVEPTISSNADSEALMKQAALADLLGGWKEGILTIGTLGCDPLKSLNQNKEYYALASSEYEQDDQEPHVLVEGDDEDNYNAEREELNPLMHTTFEHSSEDVDTNCNASKEVVAMPMALNKLVAVTPLPVISHEAIESSSNEVETEQEKKKGERITLADLFYGDSDVTTMKLAAKVMLQTSEKTGTLKANKRGLSFTKKLIPRVKDNPHPIKDIKKLMKKMLKRKIHPELDVKNHKAEGSAAGISDDNDKHEAKDTASLLPI